MSQTPASGPPEPPDPDEPNGSGVSPGHLKPIGPGPLTAVWVVGLVLGWAWHPLAERINGSAPLLSWIQPAVLFFVAAILGSLALVTWRAVHVRRELLAPQPMVNRLVLARACALVGALVAGVYAGYAVSWLGSPAELANERIWRAGAAALAGVTIVATAKLLERACRVPDNDPHP